MNSRRLVVSTVAAVLLFSVALTGCAAGKGAVAGAVETLYALESLSGVEAQERQARDTAILQWAERDGVRGAFSVADLREKYNEDRATRGEDADPAARYGAQTLSFWNFYTEHVERVAQSLRASILKEITEAQARTYYEAHPAQFARQDTLTVRITDWEGARAFGVHELTIDAGNVRMLQEADDLAISAALDLDPGEQTSVDRGDGRQALIECLTRVDAGAEPFDEVMQAAAMRLASDVFESELQRRISDAQS